MRKKLLLNISVLLGAIFFNALFWGEQMGLNTLLFTLPILGTLFFFYPEIRGSRSVLLLGLGLLSSSVFVVLNNSTLSKIIFWLTFFLLAGIVQQRELKFLFFGGLLAISNFFKVPIRWMENIETEKGFSSKWKTISRYLKMLVLPIIIVLVFFQIYALANVKFAEISREFGQFIVDLFTFKFDILRLFHWLIGLFLVGMLLLKSTSFYFLSIEKKYPDTLERIRKKGENYFMVTKMLSLKNEYQGAILLLVALNILLALVNLTDFWFVWTDNSIRSPQQLSNFVHEGTSLLILSILIAVAVLLWIFRDKLNFYAKNDLLKKVSFLWIFQNAILAFSVARRNWRYIEEYGLAHKRIGVFIFLTMVLIGLIFLYFKIENKKSLFYLLSKNSWSIWLVLVLAAAVNWDVVITRYNLSGRVQSEQIDASFLIWQLSDKNLFLLKENEALLIFSNEKKKKDYTKLGLESKEERLILRKKRESWLSWNYPDFRNLKRLKGE